MSEGEIQNTYSALLAALRAEGTPERAAQEKRYQKSRWEHWGVPLPRMDAVIRAELGALSSQEILALARRLWAEPVWDLKMVAGRMIALKRVPADKPIWNFIVERLPELDGWAVADNLAPAASRCLIAGEKHLDEVERWIASAHLWTRRAALVFTLAWMKQARNPERMLGWSARLTGDREWFIQKAIGWRLRELSKRDPARVRRFLAEHGAAMKPASRGARRANICRRASRHSRCVLGDQGAGENPPAP